MSENPPAPGAWGRLGWPMRCAALALALWLGLGPNSRELLQALVPVQAKVLAVLMPDFNLYRFGIDQRGPHLKLSATVVNRRYIVMQSRAIAPGMGFDVETPARTGMLYPTLLLIGLALAWPASGSLKVHLRALLFGVVAALAMAILTQPFVLAGEVWALGVGAAEEPTLAAAMVTISGFLLHGGGFALCAALAWSITRTRLPASSAA